MLRLIRAGVCAAFIISAAAPALAQTPAAPAAAAVNPAKAALVRRMFAAIHMERTMDSMMGSLLPVILEAQLKQHPELGPQEQAELTGIVRDVMREQFTPKIIERMIPIYADTFTEAELKSVVDFYESPGGQAVITKMPAMMPKAAEVTRDLLPEMEAETVRRICAKFGCGADATAPRANAS